MWYVIVILLNTTTAPMPMFTDYQARFLLTPYSTRVECENLANALNALPQQAAVAPNKLVFACVPFP